LIDCQGEDAAEHDGVNAGMEHHAYVPAVGRHEEVGGDAACRREEHQENCDIEAGLTREENEGKRPKEIELLLEAEGPQVGQDDGGCVEVVVPDVKSSAYKAVEVNRLNMEQTADTDNGKKNVERRENAKGSADVEVSQTDFASFSVLFEKEVGDEVPADDEKDGYAQMAIAKWEEEVIRLAPPQEIVMAENHDEH
jgi:hypothetical protein